MKSLILFFVSFLACLNMLDAQSRTQEFKPIFEKGQAGINSEVIDYEVPFDEVSFVGISAFHFDKEYKNLHFRTRQRLGWSEWRPLKPQHEIANRIRTAYEGAFITEAFSAVQLRSEGPLETSLTLRLFIGLKDTENINSETRSSTCEQPEFCDRDCWCPECPVDATPQFTGTTHLIVHHSAGSNDPNLNFTEVVNFIWDLHVNTNGWDDIGYNWLIDPEGKLYEGRPDGYQGAHFSCINENTVGICLLGDFTNQLPTPEAINTLVNTLGYEATDHDLDVLSEGYHETGDFNLTTIAGHRDSAGSDNACSGTSCPGNTFYPMLDSIRAEVADLECYRADLSSTQAEENLLLKVYPNPFTNAINIRSRGNIQLQIINLQGSLVNIVSTNKTEDLSYLESGIYFLMHQGKIIDKLIKL